MACVLFVIVMSLSNVTKRITGGGAAGDGAVHAAERGGGAKP